MFKKKGIEMKRKISFVIVLLLLISSISVNIYFLYTYKIAKTNIVSQKACNLNTDNESRNDSNKKSKKVKNVKKKTTAKSSNAGNNENVGEDASDSDKWVENIFKNNPIDKFSNAHKSDYDTYSMNQAAMFYRSVWKKEMDHAYSALSNAGNKDAKTWLKTSQSKLNEYGEIEAEIACLVTCSNAFGDEGGNISDQTGYGTMRGPLYNYEISDIYKQRTKELFRYCKGLGININFVFNENSLNKDDLALFKKK
jgi:hypothetical protein